MKQDPFPLIPAELLAALEQRFPDKCPEPHDTADAIQRQIGAIGVIRFLRSRYDIQNKTSLPRT